MTTLTVSVAAVVVSVLALLLKRNNAEYSFILAVSATAMALIYLSGYIIETVDVIKEIFSKTSISMSYLVILLKCVGISFISEFASDCSKDAGQVALSSIVLTSGRISVLICALPLFTELLSMVSELCGG
ncbi:MAG: hypothetical protein E7532_02925 [Ruminococcaceae bacterium]|nr:hypothetical protein [Oscillospiraceae bacterium]